MGGSQSLPSKYIPPKFFENPTQETQLVTDHKWSHQLKAKVTYQVDPMGYVYHMIRLPVPNSQTDDEALSGLHSRMKREGYTPPKFYHMKKQPAQDQTYLRELEFHAPWPVVIIERS